MFLRSYRKSIAKAVETKMLYMGCCPNEIDIVLTIIAPKDYNRDDVPHCSTDCWNEECKCNSTPTVRRKIQQLSDQMMKDSIEEVGRINKEWLELWLNSDDETRNHMSKVIELIKVGNEDE